MPHCIYIVEDHAIMREMIHDYLIIEPDFAVCGMAATGEEAFDELAGVEVDLVLVDTALPGMSGIDLVRALVERRPGLRCLMYSGHGEAIYVERALAAGARGYVMKGGSADELSKAIRQVIGGDVYLSEALQDRGHVRPQH